MVGMKLALELVKNYKQTPNKEEDMNMPFYPIGYTVKIKDEIFGPFKTQEAAWKFAKKRQSYGNHDDITISEINAPDGKTQDKFVKKGDACVVYR